MVKRPFFSWGKPKLEYPVIKGIKKEDIKEVPLPERITLHLPRMYSLIDDEILKKGDSVKTGQKVSLSEDAKDYFISTATGIISDISEYKGYLGRSHTSISIKTAEKEEIDNEFKGENKKVTAETAVKYLGALPGVSDFSSFFDTEKSFDTLVINGFDKDLLLTVNQFILSAETERLTKGISHLKTLTGADRIILLSSQGLSAHAAKTGAEVKVTGVFYPDALPELVMKEVFKKVVPAGKSVETIGVGFINAEGVAALSYAFDDGLLPLNKILTVIKKDGSSVMVKARIGTPVKDILSALDISTAFGDRLIFGGPMKGKTIYSEENPILNDTDGILIQDSSQIPPTSDCSCINCGECIRVCPARVPVNMLVRLLENGLYEEAAEEYDLLSCIECGLCAFVCPARIPVFQYIMLGKYEFEKMKPAEESNA